MDKQQKVYDYIIVGSGIIGSMIARELSQYDVESIILEKENDIANVQTSANSAIIHSGHDPKPHTLKAKLCVEGNQLYEELEQTMHIPLRRTGAFVIAKNKEELLTIEALAKRAKINGVPSFELLDQKEIQRQEPHLSKDIIGALSLPTTKVTFPWEVAIKACHVAINQGVTLKLNAEVTNIEYVDHIFHVEINHDVWLYAKHVVNATGVKSEVVTSFLEVPHFKVMPRRGEYFVLDRMVDGMFDHVIYPVPSKKGKGVLITPQTHGNILLGPTSELTTDDRPYTTKDGLAYIKTHVNDMCDHIPYHRIIRSFTGVRASINQDDFIIEASKKYKHFYQVAGIDSPGLTAAPAIAKYLVEKVININAPKKKNIDMSLKPSIVLKDLSLKEQQALYDKNHKYGHIVCQCEQVSEQEIIDAIVSPVGSHTIKGVKKRCRAGAGTCQGSYCQSHVLRIIARETNKDLKDICYDQVETPILQSPTKEQDNHDL